MSAAFPSRTTTRGVRTAVFTVLALATAATAITPVAGAAQAAEPEKGRTALGQCASGSLCLWTGSGFSGRRLAVEKTADALEACEVLPEGFTATAYANRTGKPVTLYQSAECAETEQFHTHPSGSWTPRSAYEVRAYKVWKR